MKKNQISSSRSNKRCLRCSQITNTKEKICVRCQLKSNLQKMLKAKLLSKEIILELFQYLEIPNEIETLSFRQVQKVERILHQIKAKTFNLELLKTRSIAKSSTSTQINSDVISHPTTLSNFRRKPSSKRRSVKGKIVEILQEREKGRCFWCDVPVIRISSVPPEHRLEQKTFTLVYLDERNTIVESAIASVDHLVRYADNGSLSPENTVLSCVKCNNEKSYEGLKWKTCRFCGTEYDGSFNCPSCLKKFNFTRSNNEEVKTKPQKEKETIWDKVKKLILTLLFQK